MPKLVNQDFIHGSKYQQNRILFYAGIGTVSAIIIALLATVVLYPKLSKPSGTTINIIVPSVGPGVHTGTKVLLRGAEVGEVTRIDAEDPYSVDLRLVVSSEAAETITDSIGVDFRPANYFGTTGVNLIPKEGGNEIVSGQTIIPGEAPDYTMSTMLTSGSLVVDGTLTQNFIKTLDKTTRYASGLSPLIEAFMEYADSLAKTQVQTPTVLLSKVNAILEYFPEANIEALGALEAVTNAQFNRLPDGSRGVDREYHDLMNRSLTVASDDLFLAIGELLASHESELLPFVSSIKNIVDPVPDLMGNGPSAIEHITQGINNIRSAFSERNGSPVLRLRLLIAASNNILTTASGHEYIDDGS